MQKIAVGSLNVSQRIRRMLAAIAEKNRLMNETRYVPPFIWRKGMRLQPSLRFARHSEHTPRDDGRPKGMSGRQWKRLQKAERMLAARSSFERVNAKNIGPILSLDECGRRINRAHASCDPPSPGTPFRRTGAQRRLRMTLEL
jgi:hypothetical protein